jgi:Flp pilus assembly pilin Flp
MQMFAIFFSRLRLDRKGQDLIEYVLMGAFVAVAACAVMPGVADSISAIFSQVGSVATSAAGSSQDNTTLNDKVTQGATDFTRR